MKNDKTLLGKKKKFEEEEEKEEDFRQKPEEKIQGIDGQYPNKNYQAYQNIPNNIIQNYPKENIDQKNPLLFSGDKMISLNEQENNGNESRNQKNIINYSKNDLKSPTKSKLKAMNSNDSDNSEDSIDKNQKLKPNSQSSRNTAFGLKEISKRVMDIIKQSGQITYRAISDQIVNEINEKSIKDEKNIRRRIYDSLNVMKSMKLFHKDKNSKTIKWNYDQEYDPLNEMGNKNDDDNNNLAKTESTNIVELKKEIKEKKEKLSLLSKELQGLKNVLERNNREDSNVPNDKKLYFPFVVIEFKSNKDHKINVALNDNQTKAHFGFDDAEAMYGDLDAVSKIGTHPNFSKKKK